MYPPPHHQSQDFEKLLAVVKEYPLGMLVTMHDGLPFVTHIPFIYNEETEKLIAHIDKNNPQLKTLVNGAKATVIFKGPETYISPSVYTSKQLPTYNYCIVHATGELKLISEPNTVKQLMVDMTDFLEGNSKKFQLKIDDVRMDRLLPYIQAFEIGALQWEGKFKLSQDKSEEDYLLAKEELIKNSYKKRDDFFKKIF